MFVIDGGEGVRWGNRVYCLFALHKARLGFLARTWMLIGILFSSFSLYFSFRAVHEISFAR